MPGVKLEVPYRDFRERCDRHDRVIAGVPSATPELQRLVAELVMIRIFDEFQEALAGIASRLVCGAPYVDGTSPGLLTDRALSTKGAIRLMEEHGRPKAVRLKWSKASFANKNTQFVLPNTEHFNQTVAGHAVIIAEMQAVRNRIAHRNENARSAYAKVVFRRYGASRNNVSPGLLLLTPRFHPPLLTTYVASCRTIIKTCVRG